MRSTSGAGWVHKGLQIATLLAFVGSAVGQGPQQSCPNTGVGCPVNQYCNSNGICVPIQNNANNTTTYIILGCVIGGIVIIVIVIIILYCGKWEWLQRFRSRMGPQRVPTRPPMAFQQPRQPRRNWRSVSKKLKLRFGGVRKNPYISNTNIVDVPTTNMIGTSGFVVPNRQPTFDTTNYVECPAGTSNLGFESSSTSPYVATVALTDSGMGTPANYNTVPTGQTVVQVDASNNQLGQYRYNSLQDLNLIGNQFMQQPAVIQNTTPQINIQAQIPNQTQFSQPMTQPMTQPIPHTHSVIPQLYPSLNNTSLGHGHTHGPTAQNYQTEIPRKF